MVLATTPAMMTMMMIMTRMLVMLMVVMMMMMVMMMEGTRLTMVVVAEVIELRTIPVANHATEALQFKTGMPRTLRTIQCSKHCHLQDDGGNNR